MLLRRPALVLAICLPALLLHAVSQSTSTTSTKPHTQGDKKTSKRDNHITKNSNSVGDITKGNNTVTTASPKVAGKLSEVDENLEETLKEAEEATLFLKDTTTDGQETEEVTAEGKTGKETTPQTSSSSAQTKPTSRADHQPSTTVTAFTKTTPNKPHSHRTKTPTAISTSYPSPSAITSASTPSSSSSTSQNLSTTLASAKVDETFKKAARKVVPLLSSERSSVMAVLSTSSMTSSHLGLHAAVQRPTTPRSSAVQPMAGEGKNKGGYRLGLGQSVGPEASMKRSRQTAHDVSSLPLKGALDDSIAAVSKSEDTASTTNNKSNNLRSQKQGPAGPPGSPGPKGDPGPPGNCSCEGQSSGPMPKFQAAVSAVLTRHFGPDKDVIVPFDLELIDLAEDYDNQSGVFFCSIPGTYVISVYLMSHPGSKVNARVFVNNRPVAALWADDTKNAGFYPSSSIQTISRLEFDDQVYVMLVDGGYGESWVHANYNVFTVFLLYEDFLGR